jgi:hypothetical protein
MKNPFSPMATWLIILLAPERASTAGIGRDKVNVRQGPGLTAVVLFQALLGCPVEEEKTRENG